MKNNRDQLVWGIFLVIVGAYLLVNQVFNIDLGDMGLFFLPALGAFFLLMGIARREAGFIIPGSILSGIGWGAFAITTPFSYLESDAQGGVFMLILGLGFVMIAVLTAVFTKETHWWALIPGTIIGIIGLSISFGGIFLTALTFLGQAWPVALILLGAYILLKGTRSSKPA